MSVYVSLADAVVGVARSVAAEGGGARVLTVSGAVRTRASA